LVAALIVLSIPDATLFLSAHSSMRCGSGSTEEVVK
jgi:hypothetical protein